MLFIPVFLGGGLGSLLRYGLSLSLAPWQERFPWATLAANAAACLLLGLILGLAARGRLSETQRLLWATGVCGGFSTFSTFTADTWRLVETGRYLAAGLNIAGNMALCLICLLLGLKIALSRTVI